MRTGSKEFWLSFFVTLGVLLPLCWCTTLWCAAHRQDIAPAAHSESNISIQPYGREPFTLLLAVAPSGEKQRVSMALVQLDAPAAVIRLCVLPGGCVLRAPGGTTTLEESYLAAGPARAAQLLAETLEAGEPAYLAATAGGWKGLSGQGQARADLSRLLTPAQRLRLGVSAVAELEPESAAALVGAAAEELNGQELLQLRTAVWDAFFRQKREELQGFVQRIREQSPALLLGMSALQLLELEASAQALAQGEAAVEVCALPGRWNGSRFELEPASVETARLLLGPKTETQP